MDCIVAQVSTSIRPSRNSSMRSVMRPLASSCCTNLQVGLSALLETRISGISVEFLWNFCVVFLCMSRFCVVHGLLSGGYCDLIL